MPILNQTHLLKNALHGTGFVRRGSAFFRVWGDGVLQVIKFQHESVFEVQHLNVGVFSMYGKLLPQWFTSSGCIPRMPVVNAIGIRFVDGYLPPDRFTKSDDEQFYCNGFPVTVDPVQQKWDHNGEHWRYFFSHEQQVKILIDKVLPWLDSITSQSLAAKAMYEIYSIPNDSLRFDAHLAAGQWDEAELAMSAILAQHASARECHCSPKAYAKYAAESETRDEPYRTALKMAQEKDAEAIRRYLSDNYSKNCELAKFCIKKK